MSRLFLDLSSVIQYAKRNQSVTGIQRVELNVAKELVRHAGSTNVLGLARSDNEGNAYSIDLAFLDRTDTLSITELLSQTGAIKNKRWPDRILLKKHLDSYKKNKLIRAWQKTLIYTQALIAPTKLRTLGLISSANLTPSPATICPSDIYLMIGTGWDTTEAMSVARRHHKLGGKVVLMVHDIIPIVRPDLHKPSVCLQFSKWMRQSTEYVDLYLCVSNHTCNDLRNYLQSIGSSTPVCATPLAHEFLGQPRNADVNLPTQRLSHLISQPYALCVGSIEGRKNGRRLLQAWRDACEIHPDVPFKLIFAGRRGWLIEDFERELAKTANACVIEQATDDELAWLYSHARFTIFPSLYEGWGLPVGESLWFGTPCIASNTSSIPEVGGDLVRYFDPLNVAEISQTISWALTEFKSDSNLARRTAFRDTKLRSWQDHAKSLFAAIH